MIWVWVAGAVLLVAAATIPLVTVRYGARGRAFLRARDRCYSLLSRLEAAIDAADSAADRALDPTTHPAAHGAADPTAHGAVDPTAHGAVDPTAHPEAQWDVAAARRSFTLAESALAGRDSLRGFRLAERWAREGLAALGQAPPTED